MAKTAMIRARVEPELKVDAERIFRKLGLTVTEAIGLFYKQVKLRKGIPFNVKVPNATTRRVLRESERGINVKSFETEEEFFKDLYSDEK